VLRKLSMVVPALLVPSLCPAEKAVFNSIPFDKFWGPTRYQQIFDASLFPPEGAYIDQVSFIPNSYRVFLCVTAAENPCCSPLLSYQGSVIPFSPQMACEVCGGLLYGAG
jgi:hypothetical protein